VDFDLMITSLPKLLGATLITLKLLSVSLIVGMFLGLFFFSLEEVVRLCMWPLFLDILSILKLMPLLQVL